MLLAAMRRELLGVERMLSHRRPMRFEAASVVEGEWAGREVILATTGIGGKKAREVVSLVADRYHPEALVCLGYAGGVSEGLKAGDLVLYSQVHLLEGRLLVDGGATLSHSESCNPELVGLARRALRTTGVVFHEGEGATVTDLICDPETKKWIGRNLSANAIDMECYWVAEAARLDGIPFLGVRAVTDPVTQRVPNIASMVDNGGGVSYRDAFLYALGHPLDIYPMLRLDINARRADRNLARFASCFISME
ncbi:MAG: hypothetical protein ACE5JL_00895 [Dehalococcoidia bacterium]